MTKWKEDCHLKETRSEIRKKVHEDYIASEKKQYTRKDSVHILYLFSKTEGTAVNETTPSQAGSHDSTEYDRSCSLLV